MKRILLVIIALCIIASNAFAVGWGQSKSGIYEEACELLSNGSYADAAAKFAELGEYEDASLLAMYSSSLDAAENGVYSLAVSGFQALGAFRDSQMQAIYYAALAYEDFLQYEDANELLMQIPFFKDSNARILTYPEMINARDYTAADQAEKNGDYAKALEGFNALGDYLDSRERALIVKEKGTYAQALLDVQNGKFAEAYEEFTSLGDYEDSREKAHLLGVYKYAPLEEKGDGIVGVMLNDLYGFINLNENNSVSPFWEELGEFDQNGLSMVALNGKYGYIDDHGKTIIPCEWDRISGFTDGLCTVAKKSEDNFLFGLYNKEGKEVSAAQWRTLGSSGNSEWGGWYNFCEIRSPLISEEKIKVQDPNGRWGFINTEGALVGDVRWDNIEEFSENVAVISENGKYGFLYKDGTVLIDPQYDDAYSFSDGLAPVKVGGKWGYIDHTNTYIINPSYAQASVFRNGVAYVYLDGTGWQIIDMNGTLQYFISDKIKTDYQTALNCFDNQEYAEAYEIFSSTVGYKDSAKMAARSKELEMNAANEEQYQQALEYFNNQEFQMAHDIFAGLNGYKDSGEMAARAEGSETARKEELYQTAIGYYIEKEYQAAYDIFVSLIGYREAIDMAAAAKVYLTSIDITDEMLDDDGVFIPGVYEGVGNGFGGDIHVIVTVDEGKITDIELEGEGEIPEIGGKALPLLKIAYTGVSSVDDVDGVSGASLTSGGVKAAVENALQKAMNPEKDETEGTPAEKKNDTLFIPGTYEGTGDGFGGVIYAAVTVDGNKITAIKLVGEGETPMIGGEAIPLLEKAYIGVSASDAVDGVSGATITSEGVKEAVKNALKEASTAK